MTVTTMTTCKICQNADAQAVTALVKYGEIEYQEANRRLGYAPQDKALWRHMTDNHEERRLSLAKYSEEGGIADQLTTVYSRLTGMFMQLDGQIVDHELISKTTKLSKEIRGLARDVVEMEQKIKHKSAIQADTIIVNFNNLNAWLAANMCQECRKKLLSPDGPEIIEIDAIVEDDTHAD